MPVLAAEWAAEVARAAAAPFALMTKERLGDREVRVSPPDLSKFRGRTPVILDDIVSTARTMIEVVSVLRAAGLPSPVCLGVHAIFAAGALEGLHAAGAVAVVTCNTITHPTNGIDVFPSIAAAVERRLTAAIDEMDLDVGAMER